MLPAVAIIGPTAIGKTEISLHIAEKFSCEIISVDSMQVYRYMDVGTAKASQEERDKVPHHLIDIVDPDEDYNVARFTTDATNALNSIESNNHIPLLVGGSGLYLRGLTEGLFEEEEIDPQIRDTLKNELDQKGHEQLHKNLCDIDPESAKRIHPNDTHRLLRALEIYQATGIPWSKYIGQKSQEPVLQNVLKIGLTCDRESLYQRINMRTQQMVELGLLDEVKKLLDMGYSGDLKSMQSIGYKHMVNFLNGEWSLEESLELLARDTRRYAKRQYTWFNRDNEIKWFQPSQHQEITTTIRKYLADQQ